MLVPWILLRTSSFKKLYGLCIRYSKASDSITSFLSSSAVRVQLSYAYRNVDRMSACVNLALEAREMFLSLCLYRFQSRKVVTPFQTDILCQRNFALFSQSNGDTDLEDHWIFSG